MSDFDKHRHDLLRGLLNDNHPQYFLADGSRIMLGDVNLGGFDISNIGGLAVDGTATFGSDVIIHGTLYGGSPLRIGTDVDILDGKLDVSETVTINGYVLPDADGNASDVMVTDGAGDVTWQAPAGGGGKVVMDLLPGSAKLPNSAFGRLEKVTRTVGVDNIIKFYAKSDGTDEHAYWQCAVPATYGGGNLTVTVISTVRTAEGAGRIAQFHLDFRTMTEPNNWDTTAFTTKASITINPTGTANQLLVDTYSWTANFPVAGQIIQFDGWVDCSNSTFQDVSPYDIEVLVIKIEED